MQYIEVFNQLDQNISDKIQDFQKQQEKLIAKKKYLLETKQKIHCFLNDAYEMKKLLDFNADLTEAVNDELNKIFQGEDKVKPTQTNQTKPTIVESNPSLVNNEDLDAELVIDAEQEEPIKIYKFVDSEGKDI